MAHLNLYVPDSLATSLKQEATAADLTLSRYVLSLLAANRTHDQWPAGFFEKTCGFLQEEIEAPADAPPEPVAEIA